MTRSEELIKDVNDIIYIGEKYNNINFDKNLDVLKQLRDEYMIAIQQNLNLEKAVHGLAKQVEKLDNLLHEVRHENTIDFNHASNSSRLPLQR